MLKLKPNPTFTAELEIPLPGGEKLGVSITFKHKSKKDLAEFVEAESTKKQSDEDTVMEIACGWSLEDEFTKPNLREFFDQYHAAARIVMNSYLFELTQAKAGN
jgi:Phage tail assembly chaperone